MMILRTTVPEELQPFMHRAATYRDTEGNEPTTQFIDPEDVISGKWKINPDIDPEIAKKMVGLAYMFRLNKENIIILL